jgi:hypothetical protein
VLGKQAVERIVKLVQQLENIPDMGELVSLMKAA